MKMRKKLMALGLSLAMTMGMSMMASAAVQDNDSTFADESSISITKEYNLTGAGVSPAETFTIRQVGEGRVTDGDAESAPELGTISQVSYEAGAAGSENKTGTFTVNLPSYEKTGVYEYTLQEAAGNTAGVTYRTDTIRLVVTVIEQDGLIRVAGVHAEDENEEKTSTFKENTYTANSLSVSKKVEGNLGDKTKEFAFTVTFTGPEGKTWQNAVTVAAGSGASDLSWNENTASFTLSDGDTVTFENIPEGVSYTVAESDYKADGYQTAYDNNKAGTMGAEAISTTVTNTKTGEVDTGISLDSLPYILILAFAAGAGILFVASRRRRAQ